MNDQPDHPHGSSPDRREFSSDRWRRRRGFSRYRILCSRAELPAQIELTNTGPDQIPRKRFGKTTERLSVIGLGGYNLGDAPSLTEAIAIVHEGGRCRRQFSLTMPGSTTMERAKSGWAERSKAGRDKVFLMTKVCTHGRGKDVAMQQLHESLKRLKTDHLDLWAGARVRVRQRPGADISSRAALIEALRRGEEGRQGVVTSGSPDTSSPAIHLKMLSYKLPVR